MGLCTGTAVSVDGEENCRPHHLHGGCVWLAVLFPRPPPPNQKYTAECTEPREERGQKPMPPGPRAPSDVVHSSQVKAISENKKIYILNLVHTVYSSYIIHTLVSVCISLLTHTHVHIARKTVVHDRLLEKSEGMGGATPPPPPSSCRSSSPSFRNAALPCGTPPPLPPASRRLRCVSNGSVMGCSVRTSCWE